MKHFSLRNSVQSPRPCSTLPPITMGPLEVPKAPSVRSPMTVSQAIWPLCASSATSRASVVAMNSLSP